jgi:hypothetical protein
MRIRCGLVLSLTLFAVGGPAAAADASDPDWPCVQPKVPELAAAQMWPTPIPEGEPADAAEIDRLARQIAQRRVSVDEAAAAAAAFVEGEAGAAREARLGQLYAAVLEQINRERGAIIGGIGRYARHQAALSDRVEEEQLELAELEGGAEADPARVEGLRQKLAWDTRIFRERSQSLTYVCETPVLLERRAFELARALAGLI